MQHAEGEAGELADRDSSERCEAGRGQHESRGERSAQGGAACRLPGEMHRRPQGLRGVRSETGVIGADDHQMRLNLARETEERRSWALPIRHSA